MQDMVSILINNDLKKTFDQNKIENLYFPDPRNKNFFLKGFCQKSSIKSLQKKFGLSKIDQNDYEKIRINNTIPEAEKDIEVGKTLLLEARFDKLNGISWEKGCILNRVKAGTSYRGKLKNKYME